MTTIKHLAMFKFIKTSQTGILLTFGKSTKILKSGLNFYIPVIQHIHVVPNQLCARIYTIDVKKDNIFSNLIIASQYRIKTENIIKNTVSTMTIDELLKSRDKISQNIVNNVFNKE